MNKSLFPELLADGVMRKELRQCPICEGNDLSTAYRFAEFSILKCRGCANAWRTNLYSRSDITAMYVGEEYAQNPYFSYDLKQFRFSARERYENYDRALTIIEASKNRGKLLDVGCGAGAFLSLAKQRGWDVSGVELSPGLTRVCRENTQTDIANLSFEQVDLPPDTYDVIAMWDLIEHVIDPVFCIQKVRQLLKPGGVALFCTPDEDSLLARAGQFLYRLSGGKLSYPALALHPTYHTYFFCRDGFTGMLEKQRMRIMQCYSQAAFFEHSQLPSRFVKWGISAIEKLGAIADHRYEIVCLAQKPD